MRVRFFGKKLLAMLLCVTVLVSCAVWTGISAEATGTTYTFDDVTALTGGNGSGLLLGEGASYDYEGKATGKAVTLKMNNPYNSDDHRGAARFQLQNAAGKCSVTVGKTYTVTAWLKSALSAADTLYWSVGTHNNDSHWGGQHNFEEIVFENNTVTLQPGTWTKVTATFTVTGNGTATNWLSFAAGFAAGKGNDAFVYVDNITVEEQAATPPPVNPPVNPPADPNAYTFDDVTALTGGNGSGLLLGAGADYDYEGKATGKAVTLKMNNAYTSDDHRGAARFQLQNAAGKCSVTVGKTYTVTAWLKSALSAADTLYWSVGTHNNDSHWGGQHNFEEIVFEDNTVTLQPGQWTKVTATFTVTGNGTDTNWLSFAAGFAAGKGNDAFVYVDNITVAEGDGQPAALGYTFDDVTALTGGNGSGLLLGAGADYDYEGKATGKAVTLKMNMAYNANDHIAAARFQLQNADGKCNVTVGKTYTVTAWLKSALSAADTLYWSVGTHNNDSHYAGQHNFEEIVFEDNTVTLQPDQWTKVTATFTVTGNGTDTNWLSFAAGFAAGKGNDAFVYVDNITVTEGAAPEEPEDTLTTWEPDVPAMTFEIGDVSQQTVYANMDLNNEDVQRYYKSVNTNMSVTGECIHEFIEEAGDTSLRATFTTAANQSAEPYGFRIVGVDSVSGGFKLEKGTVYSVQFSYKADALPVETELRVLEGSIAWNGGNVNFRHDHPGFYIDPADVGAGWKTGQINFISAYGGFGVHLILHASDYTKRAGTDVSFKDIRVTSYQQTTFNTVGDALRVENEQNHTASGKAAVKVESGKSGGAVYAAGIGDQLFTTNTMTGAVAWLYADAATTVTLNATSEPTGTVMGSTTADLPAGEWTAVGLEFGLSPVAAEPAAYVAIGVSGATATVYMDDVKVGTYPHDPTALQTYEELPAGTSANSSRLDGTLHGLNGNTVVAGKGVAGSNHALQITMRSEEAADASRAVLFTDKQDVTAAVSNGYMITFYAMAEEDLEVTFAGGTTGTIDLSDRENQASVAEYGATRTVTLEAGKWQGVSVQIADLQGKNPELCRNPYVTLAAWFAGATANNSKPVYIDNVSLTSYYAVDVTRENILCFEDTDAFGFGKELNISAEGSMEVMLEQNHTDPGYHALKVTSMSNYGGFRPQFNLQNARGEAVRVEAGKNYRVTFWAYLPERAGSTDLRWWLTVTDRTDGYNSGTEKDAELVYETNAAGITAGGWQQLAVTLENLPRSGYLRLGICGAAAAQTVFYLDDIRVNEQKTFTLTGKETVLDFEKYNLDDGDFIRYGTGYVSDEQNRTEDGSNSLRLEGVSNSGAYRNQMMLTDPATKKPYVFEKGKDYTLTFWLYGGSEYNANFAVNAWVWGTDDPATAFTTAAEKNDKNGTYEFDGSVTPVSGDGLFLPDEWNCYQITFKATNGKHMLFGLTDGSRQDGAYVYYVDDMTVTTPQPAVVYFDPNGGSFGSDMVDQLNDKGQYEASTFVGMAVVGPESTPSRSGKRFDGWALDRDGKQLFDLTADVVGAPALTLYAVWGDWGDEPDEIIQPEDEVKYRTEIRQEKVWTGNAVIPVLDAEDDFYPEDADPVTYVPEKDTDTDTATPAADGLPVWLILVIIAGAVLVVGGGATLALLLLRKKRAREKEDA